MVKNPPANAGDIRDRGLIPGSGGCPGERNGNPLQYSSLEKPIDREAHRQRSLVGYSQWDHEELDTAEVLSAHTHTCYISLT